MNKSTANRRWNLRIFGGRYYNKRNILMSFIKCYYQCFLYSRIDNVFMDFSLCSSHPELLNLVARKSGVKPGNVLLEKFANKESRVLVQENVRVRK